MRNNKIAIWCEHAYAMYSAKPIVDKYLRRGTRFMIFVPNSMFDSAVTFFGVQSDFIQSIDQFKSRAGIQFTRFYKNKCVRSDFSEIYLQRKIYTFGEKKARRNSLFAVSNKKVNSTYIKWCKLLTALGLIKRFPKEYTTVISFTKNHQPYTLSTIQDRNISIMESWDHPAQMPFLIEPRFFFTWNQDLADDTVNYQHSEKLKILFPAKFSYIENFNKLDLNVIRSKISNSKYLEELSWIENNKVVVYPVCTSSTWVGFDGELLFIKELNEVVKEAGCALYIRPYPLSPVDDLKALSNIEGAKIGSGSGYIGGGDVLIEEEQAFKYLINKLAHCVTNLGTTFGHDAALVGSPVIQLELTSEKYGIFTDFSKGLHVRKYLLNDLAIQFDDNKSKVINAISHPTNDFSNYIRNWLNNV